METNTNFQKVKAILESSSKAAVDAMLEDETVVFWVDWRAEDDAIVEYCEAVLKTGNLSAELVEVDTDEGFEIYIQYGDRRSKVPLTYTSADRHITLCALNVALVPDYEVRFCIDSNGGDTLAFIPLSTDAWEKLEQLYGEKVSKHFYRISEKPNLFTDPLPTEWP